MANTQTSTSSILAKVPTPVATPAVSEPPKDASGKPVPPKLLRVAKHISGKAVAGPRVTDKMRRDRILGVVAREIPSDEDAAVKQILGIVPAVARDVVRLEAIGTTRLAMSIRPVVAFFCSPKAGKEQITVGKTAADTLVRYLKRDLGKTDHMQVSTSGTVTKRGVPHVLKRVRLWETLGRNSAEAGRTLRIAAMAALLWVYPDCPVTVGWRAKPPTKTRDLFGNKPIVNGFPGIVAPANVLQPVTYNKIASERDGSGYPGLDPENNGDTHLIGLDSELIEALYLIYFANVDAQYETHSVRADMGVPSGMLKPYRAPRKANVSTGNATTAADTAEKAATLDPAMLHSLGVLFRDTSPTDWPMPQKDIREWLYAAVFAASCLLHRGCNDGVVNTKSFAGTKAAAACADIKLCLDTLISDDPNGNAFILRDNDKFRITGELPPTVKAPAKARGPAKVDESKVA